MVGVLGFSFSGQGQNAGAGLRDAQGLGRARGRRAHRRRRWPAAPSARCRASAMPSSSRSARRRFPNWAPASGFTFRLQDRGGVGHDALLAARNQLLGMASQSKVLTQVRPDGLEDAPQLQIDIDRDKANALGVSLRRDQRHAVDRARLELRQRLPEPRPPAARGGAGRCAGAHAAGRPAAAQREQQRRASRCRCRPSRRTRWVTGAMQTVRYNGYPAMRISGGSAAPGYSTGAAMAEMERLAAQLPPGFGYEWTGQSREEKLAGSQALILLRLRDPGGVPVPGRAVRELVDPAGGDPGGAAGRARRAAGARCCAATRTTCTSRSG